MGASAEERNLSVAVADFLLSEQGRQAGASLRGQRADRKLIEELRRHFEVAQAAALIDQERGRLSLEGKHGAASGLFVTALGAQQSSGEVAARHRARRFRDLGVAALVEVGCGLGLDTRELARAMRVTALDLDLARIKLARANLDHRDGPPHGAAHFVWGGLEAVSVRGEILYADPDRRWEGKRVSDPELASPPLSALLDKSRGAQGAAVKLSPLTPLDRIAHHGELEFVSVGRELKEVVLWSGELAVERRRVSIPAADSELCGSPNGEGPEPLSPGAMEGGGWLLDPDPAVAYSGLGPLALASCGARPLAADVAYGFAEAEPKTAFYRAERVVAVIGPRPKDVRRELRARGIGRIRVSRRDFSISPEEFERRLKLDGKGGIGRIHLTRLAEGPRVILTDPGFGVEGG
jgi:THUMP domain-containing protein